MNDEYESMMLFQDVVAKPIFDREQATVCAELCCPADFPAFAGHFPGLPILPAVIQLVIVRMLASDLLQVSLATVRTGRIKFKGMVRPDEQVKVHIALEKIGDQWNAVFKLRTLESVISAGSILFRTR